MTIISKNTAIPIVNSIVIHFSLFAAASTSMPIYAHALSIINEFIPAGYRLSQTRRSFL